MAFAASVIILLVNVNDKLKRRKAIQKLLST